MRQEKGTGFAQIKILQHARSLEDFIQWTQELLNQGACNGGPKFVKIFRLVRYRETDIAAFIEVNLVPTDSVATNQGGQS